MVLASRACAVVCWAVEEVVLPVPGVLVSVRERQAATAQLLGAGLHPMLQLGPRRFLPPATKLTNQRFIMLVAISLN